MRLPKEFEYYVKRGIIKKRSPDLARADFLLREAEISRGIEEKSQGYGNRPV